MIVSESAYAVYAALKNTGILPAQDVLHSLTKSELLHRQGFVF